MKLGIAICTYNRTRDLVDLLEALRWRTKAPHYLVVCEDGAKDSSAVRICDGLGIPVVTGENRGVAWNKNRGLYWLMTKTDASHILIIEDDMLPVEDGWERHWIDAIDKWGHANWADAEYMGQRPERVHSGTGTLESPFLAKLFTGCLMAFSRAGLEQVGYFDPSFKGYGYEHLDLTRRFRRVEMGIEKATNNEGKLDGYYVSIGGGVKMKTLVPQSDKSAANANKEVYERLQSGTLKRDAWSDDVEQAILLAEIASAARHAGQ